MKLTVNGEPRELPDGATVATLVESLGLKGCAVAVELNKEVVPKRTHSQATLQEGDRVEVVSLVGGG